MYAFPRPLRLIALAETNFGGVAKAARMLGGCAFVAGKVAVQAERIRSYSVLLFGSRIITVGY